MITRITMRVWGLTLAVSLVVLGPLQAGSVPGKLLYDWWDAAYLEGQRTGFFNTQVWETEKDGKKLLTTMDHQHLVVKRNEMVVLMRMEMGTTESPTGKVLGLYNRINLGPEKQLLITGKVSGKELQITLDNRKSSEQVPWDGRALGLYKQKRLLAEHKAKPGDTFHFWSFELVPKQFLKHKVQVKDFEEVELFAGKTRKKLLRVEVTPEKLEQVQLPPLHLWVDKDYVPLRSETQIPGFGRVVCYRSDKATALGPVELARLTDIGIGLHIRLRQKITNPYNARFAVYRITIQNDDDPGSVFARDSRQQIKNVKDHTLELYVRASTGPGGKGADKKPDAEYTRSSYFINCDDVKVRELAGEAVGAETDPWQKALRIEKWVHKNMTFVSEEAMSTADHVARTLRGDCTEHAMLTAAMCRAQGIPSRTAVGLIYGDAKSGPIFAFHMWTEVWVKGRWVPIDATLGRGYVGATHLKISDHSWNDTRTLTPLLPLLRVQGRISIEVIQAE